MHHEDGFAIDPSLVEKHCYTCNVSSPPEYKNCLHCGARLAKGGRTLQPGVGAGAGSDIREGGFERPAEDVLGEIEDEAAPRGGRLTLNGIWFMLMIGVAIANTCARG